MGGAAMRAGRADSRGDGPDNSAVAEAGAGRPTKRSFTIGGHRTSISLETAFWEALQVAAARERVPASKLIASIDEKRKGCGLSSAVRVWLLAYYRNRLPPEA